MAAEQDPLTAFDDPSFRPIDFVNKLFPNEPALEGVDPLIAKLQLKIRRVDNEILDAVREQSSSGTKAKEDLDNAMKAIMELNGHIQEIKTKADQSEAMVQEICRDIKKLDYAKKHLTSTITALRQLGMLVTAVDQLEVMANKKQYRDAANLLEAVTQLAGHFESYRDIPKIAEVRGKVANIKLQLRELVFNEFSRFGREGSDDAAAFRRGELADACLVVEALEPHVKEELVGSLCNREITSYMQIFSATQGEASHLDKVERRYAYIKQKIKQREDSWSIFPVSWRVPQLITLALCKITRTQVLEMLDAQHHDVPATLQALHRTLDFERELDGRFGASRVDGEEEGEGEEGLASDSQESAAALRKKYAKMRREQEVQETTGGKVGKMAMEAAAREAAKTTFLGSISGCFEPHMKGYVDLEEQQLMDGIDNLIANETWAPDANNAAKTLSSAGQVFIDIKKVMKRCSALTRGGTLFALSQVFQRVLRHYVAKLLARLPKDGHFQDGEEKVLCFIVNTAEYCQNTVGPLGDSMARMLEPPYNERVDMSGEEDECTNLVTAAIAALVSGADARLEPVLTGMTKVRWGELEAVGDQSDYVTACANALQTYVPSVGENVSQNYFQFFVEKLAASFAPKFYGNIFKCRRFNDAGAQQLLLDTHAMKSILLELPSMGQGKQPTSYAKLVGREMTRAESLLKVIQTPQEAVGDMFRQLLPEATAVELKQVCELKGMRAQDTAQLLEAQIAKGLAVDAHGGGGGGGARASQGPVGLRLGAGLSTVGAGAAEGLRGIGAGVGDAFTDLRGNLGDLKNFKVKDALRFPGDGAGAGAEGGGAGAGDRFQKLRMGLKSATEALKDGVKDGVGGMKEGLGQATQIVGDAAGKAAAGAGGGVGGVKVNLGDKLGDMKLVGNKIGNLFNKDQQQ